MSCGNATCPSTGYPSTNYIETVPPSFPDLGRSRQIPLAWPARIALGWERRHQRRELLELDDRLLADIGISRQDAVEEALKSSWTHVMMWHIYR
jgi:uncharacterized protein YjiS (DUF1127 family)